MDFFFSESLQQKAASFGADAESVGSANASLFVVLDLSGGKVDDALMSLKGGEGGGERENL